MKRTLVSSLLAFAVLALISCGGKGSPTAPQQSAPPPTPPSVQTVTGSIGVFGTTFHTITIVRGGNMTIVLNWQGLVDLDMYLANAGCSTFAVLATCQSLGTANGFANPESIARTVAVGDTFKLFVDNTSRIASANYTITLTVQ